jgi:hypothetical protein
MNPILLHFLFLAFSFSAVVEGLPFALALGGREALKLIGASFVSVGSSDLYGHDLDVGGGNFKSQSRDSITDDLSKRKRLKN